ncbi:MAG TPA: protease pro-enzyme activation domain-containing protein, partial [Candidatus Elarobacter sp.]|nr:protease pro-enzyme activation domain-containing protein [Candidatus Elarobacter sp.]
MKLQSLILRNSLLVLTMILALPAFRAAAQAKPDSTSAAQTVAIPARITQAIDETQLVRLRGNVHPLARPEFDRGPVSDATPMDRMLLLLQRSPDQEAALRQFMDQQQMKDSPNFQKWLTPQEFARLYGPADADIQTVTDWLTRQGFHNLRVGAGRTVIEFSGNVGQVRNTFHTEIHRFNVNGEARQANVADPQIPAALTPVVAGIVSLHNFPTKSMRHTVGAFTRNADGIVTPQFTGSTNQFFAVGPADFAKIYNIPSTLDGTGGKIAIIGFSSIDVNDARAFRTLFGLPVNDPVIVNNGPDPG